jgi:hypothetical protein
MATKSAAAAAGPAAAAPLPLLPPACSPARSALLLLCLALLFLLPAPLAHLCALSPRSAVLSAAGVGAPAASAAAAAAAAVALGGARDPSDVPPLPAPFARDALRSPPCRAPFYVYAELDAITELPYLVSVVLAGAREACGACVRLRHRLEFPIHLRAGLLDCAGFLLAATFEMTGDELAALRARPALVRDRMLYLHLSDEHEDRSVEGYELPRLILRNYYSASPDRLVNITYLQPSGGGEAALQGPPARSLWVPLGFAANFMPQMSRALNLPSRDRPLAWSWAGSREGKWARDYFLKGLEDSPHRQAIMDAGRLHVYRQFMDGGMMKPAVYSAWLYESRVAPCPNGGSAEQFRVWEALLAGAIPIVPARDAHLRYLRLLGLRALEVAHDRWALDPAPLLLAAATNATFIEELEGMQAENAGVLRRVFHALQARVGAEVCAAAGLPCAAGSDCPATHAPMLQAPEECSAARGGKAG